MVRKPIMARAAIRRLLRQAVHSAVCEDVGRGNCGTGGSPLSLATLDDLLSPTPDEAGALDAGESAHQDASTWRSISMMLGASRNLFHDGVPKGLILLRVGSYELVDLELGRLGSSFHRHFHHRRSLLAKEGIRVVSGGDERDTNLELGGFEDLDRPLAAFWPGPSAS